MSHDLSFAALAALGAYHGINPGMGWLFAVSQGLQHRERRAVVRSWIPIAIGHEASLALVAGVVLIAGATVDTTALHIGAAAILLSFGVFRFLKPRAHFRWTTMRVNRRELSAWSFLMATAHGAGLMVAPVLIGAGGAVAEAHDDVQQAAQSSSPLLVDAVGLAIHVGAMLVVMACVSLLVYERLGVEVLRRAWLNTDRIWAGAFVLAAVATLVS